MARQRLERLTKKCSRPGCDQSFEVRNNAADANRRFCSRSCARQVENQARSLLNQQQWEASDQSLCPCGLVRIPYVVRHTTKYCSTECRLKYGEKKGRAVDPTKHITFNCETCGKEVTRNRKYGHGANRFCTNGCAAKWTKKVRHIGIRDADVVLDSGWEALVWGLCTFWKIPIQRVDRALAVPVGDGWYAPDFVVDGSYVEVKGFQNNDDPVRWAAWEELRGPVQVWDRQVISEILASGGITSVTKP